MYSSIWSSVCGLTYLGAVVDLSCCVLTSLVRRICFSNGSSSTQNSSPESSPVISTSSSWTSSSSAGELLKSLVHTSRNCYKSHVRLYFCLHKKQHVRVTVIKSCKTIHSMYNCVLPFCLKWKEDRCMFETMSCSHLLQIPDSLASPNDVFLWIDLRVLSDLLHLWRSAGPDWRCSDIGWQIHIQALCILYVERQPQKDSSVWCVRCTGRIP